jgi:hypothetical protein
MIRARQIAALAGVTVVGFGASFALGRPGDDGHRAGPEAAGRPVALSVPLTLAAGALPLPGAVPDLAIPHPVPPAGGGGGGASTPSASTPPASAPAPRPATATAPKSTTAPKTATATPTPAPAPQPTTTHPKPAPQQPTVTTIIGG